LNSLNILAGKISPQNQQDENGESARMNGSNRMVDQPDGDAIKMFVGQIPRSMDENDLRKMFEDYGSVYQINVLRDKLSGQSKGCCFVTFYKRKDALQAQNDMHNIKTLGGMHHPIQMKPADSENRNERKLFVGMLSKKVTESEVRMLFNPYGTIEECTVLRDNNTVSRGCAFVTYTSRQSAVTAIKTMHHSQTMEGCSSPMVVKFADTQKEKDQKRIHQATTNLWGIGSMGLNTLTPQYLTGLSANGSGSLQPLSGLNALNVQQLLAASTQNSIASTQAALQSLASLHNSGGLSLGGSNGTAGSNDLNPAGISSLAALANFNSQNINAMNMQNLAALAAIASNGNSAGIPSLTSSAFAHGDVIVPVTAATGHWAPVVAFPNFTGTSLNGAAAGAGQQGGGSVSPLGGALAVAAGMAGMTGMTAGLRQQEGPEGANLFIYHLPQEFGDNDLAQAFSPFGNILSAKVFIDKQTNLSKCFGFVSYDNPLSSQAAIQAMNGFQIGTKRLKVQLKRSKDASKPY